MDVFADQGKVRAIYHVSVGVSDIEHARRFYGAILSALGYKLLYPSFPRRVGRGSCSWLNASVRAEGAAGR